MEWQDSRLLRKGASEFNGCGAGAEVLWESPNRPPGCLGRSSPPLRLRCWGTGESLAAPPVCLQTPRLSRPVSRARTGQSCLPLLRGDGGYLRRELRRDSSRALCSQGLAGGWSEVLKLH